MNEVPTLNMDLKLATNLVKVVRLLLQDHIIEYELNHHKQDLGWLINYTLPEQPLQNFSSRIESQQYIGVAYRTTCFRPSRANINIEARDAIYYSTDVIRITDFTISVYGLEYGSGGSNPPEKRWFECIELFAKKYDIEQDTKCEYGLHVGYNCKIKMNFYEALKKFLNADYIANKPKAIVDLI